MWYEGDNLLLFEPETGAVGRIPRDPERLISIINGPILVMHRPRFRFTAGFGAPFSVFDERGEKLFERMVPCKIENIVGDDQGRTVVLTSVDLDDWQTYRVPYKMDDGNRLFGFDADGHPTFKWQAPGPLYGQLAVGAHGELLCASQGRLHAIG